MTGTNSPSPTASLPHTTAPQLSSKKCQTRVRTQTAVRTELSEGHGNAHASTETGTCTRVRAHAHLHAHAAAGGTFFLSWLQSRGAQAVGSPAGSRPALCFTTTGAGMAQRGVAPWSRTHSVQKPSLDWNSGLPVPNPLSPGPAGQEATPTALCPGGGPGEHPPPPKMATITQREQDWR